MARSSYERLVERVSGLSERYVSRRGFLAKSTLSATAFAVAPRRFTFEQVAADEVICGPGNTCSSGWTTFCCTINGGQNLCPPGSIAAGWWKNDNSPFCAGKPRYIIDCNASCGSCGCGRRGVCAPSCQNFACRCNDDPSTCDRRRVACTQFRYGQCSMDTKCVGAVVCRIATCQLPWEWDASCSTTSATSNATNDHNAPCMVTQTPGVAAFGGATDFGSVTGNLVRVSSAAIAVRSTGLGYWVVSEDGIVSAFGDAPHRVDLADNPFRAFPIRGIEPTPSGDGYWLLDAIGGVYAFGDAVFHGAADALPTRIDAVAMVASAAGDGYWIAARNGSILGFGNAPVLAPVTTTGPSVGDSAVALRGTADRTGLWLAFASGLVLPFGSAQHFGDAVVYQPHGGMTAMAATVDGSGYYLLTHDGGVFSFGTAAYRGGLGDTATAVRRPAVGLATNPIGDGYWMLTAN
jgi:hypothetical protein